MSKKIYLFSTSTHPDAISINSLHVTLLKPEIEFSKYDYLIITSKQASQSLKQYDDAYLSKKALCISNQTADSFELIGGSVLDIASGYGDDLSRLIKNYSKTTRWLYLRATEVASDFAHTCRNDGYMIDEKIVYETLCSKDIEKLHVESDAVLIFTSPSSLKCFLKTNDLDAKNSIIVIGKTTAKALPEGTSYSISEATSIESCIELAKRL